MKQKPKQIFVPIIIHPVGAKAQEAKDPRSKDPIIA